jgi:hypothetical protein
MHPFRRRYLNAISEALMMEEVFYCILCKRPMSPAQGIGECSFCGKREEADYVCPSGHYICEDCRIASSDRIIKRVCEVTRETDPIRIAVLLMKHPAIRMHGPEHHYLVSCVLLAALRNLGNFEVDNSALEKAVARGKRIPLGSCGLWGACGAAIGVGIAISVATKSSWTADKERSLSMQATCEALSEIAKIGGPRCCKASTFAAIEAASKFLKQEFGVDFTSLTSPRPCCFKAINDECLGNKCPYFE